MKNAHRVILLESQASAPAGPTYETPAYANAGGIGNRIGQIAITVSGSTMWGGIATGGALDIGVYINGDVDDNGGYTNDGVPVANEWMEWSFVTPRLITEIKIYWNAGAADCGIWRIQCYDGASWVNVGNTFTLGTTVTQVIDISGNVTGYTKYRMLGVSGNSSFNLYYWSEMEFKIGNLL